MMDKEIMYCVLFQYHAITVHFLFREPFVFTVVDSLDDDMVIGPGNKLMGENSNGFLRDRLGQYRTHIIRSAIKEALDA